MKNIRQHTITFSPDHIENCWDIYKAKYIEIESRLLKKPDDPYYSTYVHSTGAFQVDSSITQFSKTNLYKFFISPSTNQYTIYDGNKYILRGLMYYPDLLTLPTESKLKSIVSSLQKVYRLIDNSKPEEENHILYLASLDYVKNYLLIILHSLHLLQGRDVRMLDIFSQSEYEAYLYVVYLAERQFTESWEKKSIIKGYLPEMVPKVVLKALKAISFAIRNRSLSDSDHLNLFRSYRENNNPIKQATFGTNIAKEFLDDVLIIGIEYGGIELPFIVNAYRESIGKTPLDFLLLNLSTYSENNTASTESIYDSLPMYLRTPELSKYKEVLIVDDSITTGRTISILNSLLPENIENVYFATISMKLSNRYHHLTRDGHGGLNPQVMSAIQCNYKSNYTTTYSSTTYTDKNGIFNKEKHEVKSLLRQNYFEKILKNG